MRAVWLGVVALAGLSLGTAATLERLSLEELIEKSTSVVRGRLHSPRGEFHGPVIYTRWTVEVSERWKGPEITRLDVVIPGGVAGGLRQTFSGAPKIEEGGDYVLFLWTGRNGLTHVVGLSQGLFTVGKDASGGEVASRPAAAAAMLDLKTGRVVADGSVRLRLTDLRARVATAAGARQ